MLISDSMEALATKPACISLDAGPLQRVWCHPCRLGIPRGHLCGDTRISLWPWEWWTGIQSHHRRYWATGGPRGSGQRSGHCSEGGSSWPPHVHISYLLWFRSHSPLRVWAGSGPTGTRCSGRTRSTWASPPVSSRTEASAPSSRCSSTPRRSSVLAMSWHVSISASSLMHDSLFQLITFSVSGYTMTTRTSSATSSFLDSSPSLRGTSFTLLPPMLSVSCTPSKTGKRASTLLNYHL